MPSYPIRITKNDMLVGNFLSAPTQVPISNIITLAIEYYATFGEYLHIGTAMTDESVLLGKRKGIYIPNGSLAEKYLTQFSKDKEYKKAIIRIIEGGISIGDENSVISKKEYFQALQKLHSAQNSQYGINMAPKTIVPAEPSKNQPETVSKKEEYTEAKPVREDQDSTGGGLEFAFGFIKGVENLDKD